MSRLEAQYAVAVNGHLCQRPEVSAFYANIMGGPKPTGPKVRVFNTRAGAEQFAREVASGLSGQFGIEPMIQVVHRWCSPWIGGDETDDVAGRFEDYLKGQS